jgi:hypothetical protein
MNHTELIATWVRQYRIAQKTTYRTPTDLVREKTKSQIATEIDRARVLGEALKAFYGKHPLDFVTRDEIVQQTESKTVSQILEKVL